jgi:arginine/lysine/ornithine decarboxylase
MPHQLDGDLIHEITQLLSLTGHLLDPGEDLLGRAAAEMITPYPPGIPAVLPGERLTQPVTTCARAWKRA